MKKVFLLFILLFLVFNTPVFSQVSCSMPLGSVKGISLGYSYRPIFIFGTGTSKVMYPTHCLFFNLDGDVTFENGSSSSYNYYGNSNDDPTFAGLGLVLGFSAADRISPMEAKDLYYSDHYRITSLNTGKGDMLTIGAVLRIMIPLDFSSEKSITDSYVNLGFEVGSMSLMYNGEAGAFNKYVTKEVSNSGTYLSMNVGLKVLVFEVYGGIGGLFGLYKKGLFLENPDGEAVSNNPDKTNHFISYVGAGLVFDLHSMSAFED